MIWSYRYHFANTDKNMSKFYNPLKEFCFEFPAQSGSFFSNTFFKVLELDSEYETYIGVSCDSPINEGIREVHIQTTAPPNERGGKGFSKNLQDLLESVEAKEI